MKINFKKVSIIILSILMLIISLYHFVVYLGLFYPYNYFTAKRDIIFGEIKIVSPTTELYSFYDFKDKADKYGVTVKRADNIYYNYRGLEMYNKQMWKQFKRKHKEQYDSLMAEQLKFDPFTKPKLSKEIDSIIKNEALILLSN